MRKTRKYLRFEQLKIELTNEHPKEISRAVLCFRDQDGNTFKTSQYGQVEPTTIDWQENYVEILYTNQQVFNFETVCEHQYDYEIEQLKALFNGQLYIKTQYFFRPLTVHIFNDEGQKCGIMRYMIKIVEKDVENTAKSHPDSSANKNEPEVKVNLLAKITFYAATMSILTPTFKKDKYINDFNLRVFICGKKIDAVYKKQFSWSFPSSSKVQFTENSPKQILFSLRHEQHQILKGTMDIQLLCENKRFITHVIPLYDNKNQKIAILKADLRYVSKQQLLDLLYSPTKLSNSKGVSKPDLEKIEKHQKMISSRVYNKRKSPTNLHSERSNSLSMINHKKKPALQSELIQPTSHRYKKMYLINNQKQMIIPRSKRFQKMRQVNPYVSYCDPQKLSDFSPSKKKQSYYKHNMSLSNRVDFTKDHKGVPGSGKYNLPSIWEKY